MELFEMVTDSANVSIVAAMIILSDPSPVDGEQQWLYKNVFARIYCAFSAFARPLSIQPLASCRPWYIRLHKLFFRRLLFFQFPRLSSQPLLFQSQPWPRKRKGRSHYRSFRDVWYRKTGRYRRRSSTLLRWRQSMRALTATVFPVV